MIRAYDGTGQRVHVEGEITYEEARKRTDNRLYFKDVVMERRRCVVIDDKLYPLKGDPT